MPTLQTLRCPVCRAEIALVRGSEVVRCLSCGSTSEIRYEENEQLRLEHLPEGRKAKPGARNNRGIFAGASLLLAALGCTGIVNLGLLGDGTFGSQEGTKVGENEDGSPSDLRPKQLQKPPSVDFDSDLPPLILPEAGGIIVAQVSDPPANGEVEAAVMVAIDPETQKKLWEIPEIRANSAVGWVGTAQHIVTLDEGGTIVIVNASSGETTEIPASEGRPQQLCKGATSEEVVLEVRGGANQRINTTTGQAQAEDTEYPCTQVDTPVEKCRETQGGLSRNAACTAPGLAPKHPDIAGEFALTEEEQGVLFGRDANSETKIVLMGFNNDGGNSTWMTELPSQDAALSEQAGAELANGVVYVTARSPGEPWQLVAVDGSNGDPLWSTSLENSEDSSMDRGISVVEDTVYVLDDDTLHRVNAETGDLLADLGAALAADDDSQ